MHCFQCSVRLLVDVMFCMVCCCVIQLEYFVSLIVSLNGWLLFRKVCYPDLCFPSFVFGLLAVF